MVAKAKENLGKMPCPCCGEPVAVMKADTGTLSFKCQDADCEQTGFAQAHTGAARKWLSKIVRRQVAAPAEPEATKPAPARQAPASAPKPQPPVPAPTPAPKPAPRAAFSLDGLR